MKIFRFAAPSQPGENMIGAEEKFTFGEVHQQRYEIISTPVNFSMVAFGYAIDAHMHLGSAGHSDGHFFA